uniref:Vitellogenin domain-containing protein n=1 Tax=Ciona savignyi TaxID=51511 RepID=H2YTN5_CIOSA
MKLIAEVFCLTLSVCCCITVPVGSSGLSYNPNKVYRYSYEAEVTLNEADLTNEDKVHRMHADVGLKVGAVFELSSQWTNPSNQNDQIIQMQFEEAEIFNVSDRLKKDNTFYSTRKSKSLRSIVKPLIFRWTNGKISELYVNRAETVTSLNIKRGILGLLQLQTQTGQRKEEDPSGNCEVSYIVDGTEVQKMKNVASCVNKEEGFTSLNKALGVTSGSTSRAIYTLSSDLSHILFAVALESHSVRVNIKQDVSLFVLGRQKLGLMDYSDQKSA